ncbi:MAG: thymidine phosphorylase [Pirellulaceae bacterium]|nr:thymidine phosphorylase [Pirellulaceae bacterium]
MVPAAIIATKRDGGEHLPTEIESMITGFVSGEVADYQMAAWAMAVVCRGMTAKETSVLTAAMLNSGSRLPRASDRPRVDKHSTGGLGDSPSVILAPLLACFELDVPMLSGRGLGITGGTLDKLEAFPGYRTNLTSQEITDQLRAIGCVITGTTPDIAPADRKLYALRDVTGTVESIPLITASIMSKKLAESLDALVLDVKFGSAAFMQNISDALRLAESLVASGRNDGLSTSAVLTAMHQPLGRMVGNACEINEAIEVLECHTSSPLGSVTLRLCSELLVATQRASDLASAEMKLLSEVESGRPLTRLKKMVEYQGGVYLDRLPLAMTHTVCAGNTGYIHAIHGRLLGQAIIELGGGRKSMGQAIDHAVGLEMLVRVGEHISAGQPIVNIFAADRSAGDVEKLSVARHLVEQAIVIAPGAPTATPLIVPL